MSAEAFPSSRVHPVEDLLEEYAFGRVAEPLLSQLEEHLLICVACQERLRHVDDYIAAMKKGTAELKTRKRVTSMTEGPGTPFPTVPLAGAVWVAAAALVLVVALVGFLRTKPDSHVTAPATVMLTSLRGTGEDATANAPAGRPLTLNIDATRLSETRGSMSLQIVSGSGGEVWRGPVVSLNSQKSDSSILSASVPEGLRPGQYWARLYSTDNTLLREFGIRVQ